MSVTYILDQTDEGQYLIKSDNKRYLAGFNKDKVIKLIDKLNTTPYANVHSNEDGVYVCWGDHHRSEGCNYNLEINSNNMTFGQAIEALKEGRLITRSGWNGKGMFLFMRPEASISVDTIVNKIESLPKALKDYYIAQFAWTAQEEDDVMGPKDVQVKFTPYICMKAADGTIVNGWLASQTDILSEDWLIYGDNN